MIIRVERRKKRSDVNVGKNLILVSQTYLIMAFLCVGLLGGSYLALKSIEYQYTGALACYTVLLTPIGTDVQDAAKIVEGE